MTLPVTLAYDGPCIYIDISKNRVLGIYSNRGRGPQTHNSKPYKPQTLNLHDY